MPPASPKVDVSAPLLRELREAADKSFTGAVDASAGGLTVSVYLEDGLVRAIQSDQFAPPMAQLAKHITGEDAPEGSHPLAFLSDSPKLGADPDARFDAVEGFIVDWSYGLLASALTWRSPSITKRKGEKSTGGIYPKDLSLVIQDVTSRVEELVDSWEIICAELARNGMEPRPASHAAPILAVTVEGDPELDGSRTVDELAYTTGATRYTVLSRVSAAILAGRSAVTFAAQHPEVDLPTYPVPEALEDAQNEWGGADVIAGAAASVPAPAPEPVPEPEPEPQPEPVDDLAGLAPYLDATPEPVAVPVPQAEVAAAPAPVLPAPYVPTEPVAPVAVATPAPEEDTFPRDWVARAADPREHEIRETVVSETVRTAGRLAAEKVESLDQAVASYEQANADLATAQGQVSAAQSELATAQAQAVEAERSVATVRAQGQAVLDALAQAQAAEAEAAARAAAAEQAVAAARAALAAAERTQSEADTAAQTAGGTVEVAKAEVEQSVGVPLRAAEAELERVRAEVVEPTRTRLETLQAGVEVVRSTFGAAEERVMDVGADAEKSITVLSTLEAPNPVTATELMGRLQQAHERVSAIRGGQAGVAGAHSGLPVAPATPAPAPVAAPEPVAVPFPAAAAPVTPVAPSAPAAVPFPAAAAAPVAVPFEAAAPVAPAPVATPFPGADAAVPFQSPVAPVAPATPAEGTDEVALPVPTPGVSATFEEVIAPTEDAVPWDGAPVVAWEPVNQQG